MSNANNAIVYRTPDDPGLDRQSLIVAMLETPILIERPIVLANAKAAFGRPPRALLGIL